MTIKEAISERHTVRQYTDRKLSPETAELLNARAEENNRSHGLDLTLVTENSDGLSGIAKIFASKGVNNYIVLAGRDTPELDENLGYCGADIILYAQTLGLNTWWIGGMYNVKAVGKLFNDSNIRINGIIAVGYGRNNGTPHKSKTAAEISSYDGTPPEWFSNGVDALLCAPTALNRQAFTVRGNGRRVSMEYHGGHFAKTDLGIGKYHFETGAGKDNFEWV